MTDILMAVDQVGHYRITAELHRGVHGIIYQAQDLNDSRVVALKAIALPNDEVQSRMDSLAAAAGLTHPNIVPVLDVFVEHGFAFIATEYVSAVSLARAFEQQQVRGYETLLLYLRQVAAALDFAHRKGVVHGDLKSADILLLAPNGVIPRGVAKVQGFGEQQLMTGRPGGADVDQLALAALVHEALTGQRAADSANISPDLSPTVGKVMERALARDPRDRFLTASDFVGALGIALAEGPAASPQVTTASSAEPVILPQDRPTSERSAKTTQIRKTEGARTPLLKSLAFILVLCAVATAALILMVRMNSAPPVPVQVLETNSAPTSPPPDSASTNGASHAQPLPAASGDVEKSLSRTKGPVTTTSPLVQPSATKSPLREGNGQRTTATSNPPGSSSEDLGPGISDVDLVSEPPGAKLVVDSRADATCTAPCTMSLPAGRHTLTAELNGYTVARRIFNIPETNRLIISLTGNDGTLLVTSSPSGSTIFVDGKSFGSTPATLHLPAGLHTLLLLNGSHQHEETVNIQPESFQARAVRW
jgi:serine/threonine protein kinase